MDEPTWAAISGLASAVSASASLVTIFYFRSSVAKQTNVADVSCCLNVVERIAEAQRKVRDAQPSDRRRYEFRELLNLLEGLALLINDNKFPPSSRRFTALYVEEALAWMEIDEWMKELVAESFTGDQTFAELQRFRTERKTRISGLRNAYEALRFSDRALR